MAVVCGLLFWVWHLPLALQPNLWQLCNGKIAPYFKAYPLYCIGFSTYASTAYTATGMSTLSAAYVHSMVDALHKYVKWELPLIDDEVVLWALAVGCCAMSLAFAPVLLRSRPEGAKKITIRPQTEVIVAGPPASDEAGEKSYQQPTSGEADGTQSTSLAPPGRRSQAVPMRQRSESPSDQV